MSHILAQANFAWSCVTLTHLMRLMPWLYASSVKDKNKTNMNLKTPQLDESYSGASKFCLVLRDIDASHAVNAGNY